MKRHFLIGLSLLVLVIALGIASAVLSKRAVVQAAGGVQAPRFEVDPMWPKPLPNHWIMGNVIGVSVDAQDHIWIIHRAGSLEPKEVYASTNPPGSDCCLPAPPVLAFDEVVRARVSIGPIRITGSRLITRATSGSAAMAAARLRGPPGGRPERLLQRPLPKANPPRAITTTT